MIDGVVPGREAQGFSDFLDIKSIEVIKGPQGTLFGKNASAGVINIQTNDPAFSFGGSADATYGSFNETKLRGTVAGPLVDDKLAFRLTGTYNRRNGVLGNAIVGQRHLNDRNSYARRGKLLYQPNPDLKFVLSADVGHSSNRCCMSTYRFAGSPAFALNFATNPGVLQLRTALAALGIVPGPGNRKVGVRDSRILERQNSGGVALNVDYNFGDSALSSITSWRKWNIDEFNEADGVSNSRTVFDPGYSMIGLESDDLERDVSRLVGLGGAKFGILAENDFARAVVCSDPQDNLIELMELKPEGRAWAIAASLNPISSRGSKRSDQFVAGHSS